MGVARALGLLLVALFTLANALGELDYGIMIDAGSSGSRIYLYEWPHRDNNSLPLVEPVINQTVISLKINIPLSSFANDPSDAGESLTPLIKYVMLNLDPSKYASTPIFLKATAGMRALNQSTQRAIISDVAQYLETTPFEFQPNNAQVIPGNEEGMLGWITTNYALYVLQKHDPTSTFGALDMGGASTQITFIPQAAPTYDNYNLYLAEIEYPLYTYSYNLGQSQSLSVLLSGLIHAANARNVYNPCYPAGYDETYGYFNIIGSGNYSQCVDAVEQYIVTKNPYCSRCGIGNTYQPPLWGNFYAFSGFAYTFGFYGLTNSSSIRALQEATEAFCETPWATIKSTYSSVPIQYLKDYCFTGSYFSDLLNVGYGFSLDETSITVQSQVGSIELTWALGGMIYEASLLPIGSY